MFLLLRVLAMKNSSLQRLLPQPRGSRATALGDTPALNILGRHTQDASVCPAGSLPEAWGSAGAFPLLRVLAMKNSSLQGPLPQSWGSSGMRSLTILTMDSNRLSGSLPPGWSQGFSSLS